MTQIMNSNHQTSKFGTHPMFDIDGLDWLCQHLTATPARLFDDFNAPAKSDSDYSGGRSGVPVSVQCPRLPVRCAVFWCGVWIKTIMRRCKIIWQAWC